MLLQAMGHFQRILAPAEQTELLAAIEAYRQGDLPLIVPVTLLNHYVWKYDQALLTNII